MLKETKESFLCYGKTSLLTLHQLIFARSTTMPIISFSKMSLIAIMEKYSSFRQREEMLSLAYPKNPLGQKNLRNKKGIQEFSSLFRKKNKLRMALNTHTSIQGLATSSPISTSKCKTCSQENMSSLRKLTGIMKEKKRQLSACTPTQRLSSTDLLNKSTKIYCLKHSWIMPGMKKERKCFAITRLSGCVIMFCWISVGMGT